MSKFETYVERVPVWALCYIINGDPSGLEDSDISLVDSWLAGSEYEIISPRAEDPYFSTVPAFGLASDVVDCDCLIRQD